MLKNIIHSPPTMMMAIIWERVVCMMLFLRLKKLKKDLVNNQEH